VSTPLSQAATWYAVDISQNPSSFNAQHMDSLGRDAFQRMADCGSPLSYQGENALWGYSTAMQAFNAWKASPGHNANMLRAQFKVIGIGRVGSIWVTDFASLVHGVGAPPGTEDGSSPAPTEPSGTEPPPTETATSEPTQTATSEPTATAPGVSIPGVVR
ncbi:MAG: CAP domain-containing protein, partial [Dehalococcoidia bacterium]